MFLSSVGESSSSHVRGAFGRFDLVPGEENEGSPLYRQAHSKEIGQHSDSDSDSDTDSDSKEIPKQPEIWLYR